MWQLRLQPVPKRWFEIGELLIQNLNDDGFHIEDPKTLVKEEEWDTMEAIMGMIRKFDPPGVCVKDFMESLLVQIDIDPEAPEGARLLVQEYFDLLEKGKTTEILRKMKITQEEYELLVKYIKTLNPFPGRNYSQETPRYVIPDLMVKLKEGEFVLILNDEEIPVLGINPFFSELAEGDKGKTQERDVKTFVNANIKNARWFIRSIHQRNHTLLKIAKAIVEFPRDFLMKAPN